MRRLIAISGLIVTLATVPAAPPGIVKACTAVERATTGCGSTDGSSVTVSAERSSSDVPESSSASQDSVSVVDAAAWLAGLEAAFDSCVAGGGDDVSCQISVRVDEDAPVQAGAPAVTVADVASFAPDAVGAVGDPLNAGVAGRPMNIVAPASTHTREGSLFGAPVRVRFTPSVFVFDYGDGTTVSLPTGGSTWEQLGQDEFTDTPTSHVYADRGLYDVTVTVRYSVEVDTGAGRMPLAGELSVPGSTLQVQIYEAHTALVAHTCSEDPDAVGC